MHLSVSTPGFMCVYDETVAFDTEYGWVCCFAKFSAFGAIFRALITG